MSKKPTQLSLFEVATPVVVFIGLLLFGLFVYPRVMDSSALPIEVLILLATTFSGLFLYVKGYDWETIQRHIVKKVGECVPVIMILFVVGLLIGSWIVSGTIPMLIYYGISLIDPSLIYFYSFLICIVFSLLTGTSWGSAGTIGIVMISIGEVYGVDIAINAAAIVGGSFFGDKMSPLSDTTNIASLASNVSIYDHIYSMSFTTGPAAIIAAIIYVVLSGNIVVGQAEELSIIKETLAGLDEGFTFNVLLLLPLLVVIYGSLKKKSIFLTLLVASWTALLLAIVFQSFSLLEIMTTLKSGFNVSLLEGYNPDSQVLNILNRGGLYSLIDGIVVAFLVFVFIGTLDVIDALNRLLQGLLKQMKKVSSLVATTLASTLITNLFTSNQYATSFIIGEAFKDKYDELKVDRKVLSRSLEDAGTMMENLFPWTPSGIFMAASLGVSSLDYAPWQFLSLINIVIAFCFAFTGIACFKAKD